MRRTLPAIVTLVAALGIGIAPAASAATPGNSANAAANPTAAQATYTSETTSPLLGLGTGLGLFTITGFGGTTYTPPETTFGAGTITSPVNGNPMVSQTVQEKGGITLTKPDGSTLTIQSIRYDVTGGVVTGVVAGHGRIALYDAVRTSETTTNLTNNPEGAALMRAFLDFPLPTDNSDFGTATLTQVNG